MNLILLILSITCLTVSCFALGYLFGKIHEWGEAVMAEEQGPDRDSKSGAGVPPASHKSYSSHPSPFPGETHAETLLVSNNKDSRAKQALGLDTPAARNLTNHPTPSATLR